MTMKEKVNTNCHLDQPELMDNQSSNQSSTHLCKLFSDKCLTQTQTISNKKAHHRQIAAVFATSATSIASVISLALLQWLWMGGYPMVNGGCHIHRSSKQLSMAYFPPHTPEATPWNNVLWKQCLSWGAFECSSVVNFLICMSIETAFWWPTGKPNGCLPHTCHL